MCGIIGIYGNGNISRQLFHGLRSLQHRGHSAVGMITYDGNIYSKKEAGWYLSWHPALPEVQDLPISGLNL